MSLGGKREGAGRPRGSANKGTADIKAAFRKHYKELVEGVMELCRHEDANIRLRAFTLALERGFGKAAQPLDIDTRVTVERIERVIVDDTRVIEHEEPEHVTH